MKLKYSEIKVTNHINQVVECLSERRLSPLASRTPNLLRDVSEIVGVESLIRSHVNIRCNYYQCVFFLGQLHTWNIFDITNDVGNHLFSVARTFDIADRKLRRLWLVGLIRLCLGLLLLRLFLELLEVLATA